MTGRREVFKQALAVLHKTGVSKAVAPVTQGVGAIFMLHRVLPVSDAAFQPNKHLEITPEFLEHTVERIRENGYQIISLGEAIDLLKLGHGIDHGRARYAVLTFDDGFRDNFEIAYPILKRLQAPFTIFLGSGLLDRTTELWWVALEQLVANQSCLDLSGQPQAPSDTIACATLEDKVAAFSTIVQWLTQVVSETEQREIIRALAARYDLDLPALADELMMTWDDARELAQDPLVTLGGHTHSHFAVARLEADAAEADMALGVQRMEKELGRRPKLFAYPYGYPSAVSPRDGEIAAKLGFRACVTTTPGVLRANHGSELMQLPRVSLNGEFQDDYMIDQYLSGAPFALYDTAKWAKSGFGIKDGLSRLFPSTK